MRANRTSKQHVCIELTWIVQAALAGLAAGGFAIEEQRIVVAATRKPEKVRVAKLVAWRRLEVCFRYEVTKIEPIIDGPKKSF